MTKTEKNLLKAQQYAADAAYTYRHLIPFFENDVSFKDPLTKLAEQKEKTERILSEITGKSVTAKHGDFNFLKVWKRIFGNGSLFKNMAGSENEQGDLLRSLAKTYPSLKPIAQEYYLQATTLRRLQDRTKKKRKRK